MKYLKQTLLYTLITVAVIAAGLAAYSFVEKPKEQPKNAMVYPKFRAVKDFELKSGDATINLNSLQGKWSFIFFGYTYCPDVGPTTMSALKQFMNNVPEKTQQDTQIILVSVDPERDTPEQLKQYAHAFDKRFIGATAEHAILEDFAKSFGAIYYKVGEGEDYLVDHTAKIFLVDPQGRRHAIFSKSMENPTEGYEYNIEQMVKDYLIIRS